jgi:gliding motility-associated protein GldL
MGAAVVIVGALFKIIHFEPLTGTRMLAVGLLTEAFIFALPHLSLWIMS